MIRRILYRKATPERLKELLGRIDFKVTNQSTDGSWRLIRLPNGKSTGYWVLNDRVEHRLDDFRGGASFYFRDCVFEDDQEGTISILAKGKNPGIFLSFHNFKSHEELD